MSQDVIVKPADLVLRNGKIITVDRTFTIAESIAIAGDRVLAVCPNAAMAALTSPSTRTIDLRGKTVIPGLIDGHAHMDREGLKSVFPSLGPVRSIRDIQDRIEWPALALDPARLAPFVEHHRWWNPWRKEVMLGMLSPDETRRQFDAWAEWLANLLGGDAGARATVGFKMGIALLRSDKPTPVIFMNAIAGLVCIIRRSWSA